MPTTETYVTPTLRAYAALSSRKREPPRPPRRTAPFDEAPGFHEPAGVWLYGNVRLLSGRLAYVPAACGDANPAPTTLSAIEHSAEQLVLDANVLVTGIHNVAHQRVALVPLRWGSPRILVLSGGFHAHLGLDLKEEPFRAARLWRYQFDSKTDLVISRRAPEKLQTFSRHNPTVDRMIKRLATSDWPGLRWIEGKSIRCLV